MRASTQGFHRVLDTGLLSDFADDYFSLVEQLWTNRDSHEVAETQVAGLFPRTQLNEQTIERANTLIRQHADSAPALARMLAEARDDVARATAAQAMFH